MSGVIIPRGYEDAWNGEADCYALPIDETTYYDLFTHQERPKLETPLDRFGIVDKTALALLVLGTAPAGHIWGPKKREHHWQWPRTLYPNEPEADVNAHSFRELSANREKLPLSFERRLHLATLHPPVPETEVMAQKIEAHLAANMLLRTAREIIEWRQKTRRQRLFNSTNQYAIENNGTPDKKDRNKAYNRYKGRTYARGFRISLERYYDVPPDFRPVETGGSAEQVLGDLGRALGQRALRQALANAA